MRRLPPLDRIDQLENAAALDPLVERTHSAVMTVLKPRWLRDLLHGVPLGHPVHPLGVHVPLGAWISAALLDTQPSTERAARALVGVGVVGATGTAIAGFTDWSTLNERQKRVGLVHAGVNLLATGLYAASFVQRSRGKQASGKVLSFAGLAIAAGGGYLGGHLSYRTAAGVNRNADILDELSEGWQRMAPLNELAEGVLARYEVGGTPLVVLRRGETVSVLADTCSHLGASLHEGEVTSEGQASGAQETCVECPWHQSVFSMETGEVVHGPATSPQPKFESRVLGGVVEVHLPR